MLVCKEMCIHPQHLEMDEEGCQDGGLAWLLVTKGRVVTQVTKKNIMVPIFIELKWLLESKNNK